MLLAFSSQKMYICSPSEQVLIKVNKYPTDATVCRYLFTAKPSSFAVNKYLRTVASVGFFIHIEL